MRKSLLFTICLLAIGMLTYSCQKEGFTDVQEVPQKVIDQLTEMGFNPDGIEIVEEGYRIERDIIITKEFLATVGEEIRVPGAEQYSTTIRVATGGARNIAMFASKRFSSGMVAGLDEAIARYNAQNLEITFTRVSRSKDADIVMNRLRKTDENSGILGSAGFPTASGDPYGEIKMSGILESSYGLSTDGIATIIAHEMGHCVGFRHTDYFNRSISCGSGGNEGQDTTGVGAVWIPGTPIGANPTTDLSFMLSCTDGGDRPFTSNDQIALDYLY